MKAALAFTCHLLFQRFHGSHNLISTNFMKFIYFHGFRGLVGWLAGEEEDEEDEEDKVDVCWWDGLN